MIYGAAFAVVVVLFGSNFVAIRVLNRFIHPMFGASLRFTIAAVILITIVALKGIPWPRGKSFAAACAYGAIAYGGAFGCLFFALRIMGAAPVAVLFATAPLFTVLIAAAMKVERLTARKLIGTGVAVAGSAWIFRQAMQLDVNPLGFALCLIAAACAGLSTVVLKRAPRSHPLATNAVASCVGATILFLLALASGAFAQARWEMPALLALGWISVIGTAVGFTLVTWLILHWSPTKVNYQTVLSPIVAAVTGALILDEPIRRDLIFGALAILAGAWAVLGERNVAPAAVPKGSAGP